MDKNHDAKVSNARPFVPWVVVVVAAAAVAAAAAAALLLSVLEERFG